MLTLTRKPGQEILVGDEIRIIVKEVRGCQVRLGILAPASVIISRGEIALEVEPAADPDGPAKPAGPAKSAGPAKPARPKPMASAAPARPVPPPPGLPGLPGTGTPRFTLENLFLPDSPVGRATAAARERLSARPPRLSRAARRPPRLV
jgi:carbon storage regulator